MDCYYCGRFLDPIMKGKNIEVFDIEYNDWVYACPPGYIRECHKTQKAKEDGRFSDRRRPPRNTQEILA